MGDIDPIPFFYTGAAAVHTVCFFFFLCLCFEEGFDWSKHMKISGHKFDNTLHFLLFKSIYKGACIGTARLIDGVIIPLALFTACNKS